MSTIYVTGKQTEVVTYNAEGLLVDALQKERKVTGDPELVEQYVSFFGVNELLSDSLSVVQRTESSTRTIRKYGMGRCTAVGSGG